MSSMRWLRRSLWVLLALLIAAVAAAFAYRQLSLPVHEGTFEVPGLAAPARIVRDADGVPVIEAASEADALFALGFAHAQDRLWQMDFSRRVARGRVAEILGEPGLEADRFFRTLGIARRAEALVAGLDAETRALLAAYAAGVNAQLAARSGPLPPEFLLTRAPAPEPWTVADSAAWSLMMAWDLASMNFRSELARLRLAQRLGKAQIDEFRPPYPGESPPVTTDWVELYRVLGLLDGTQLAGAAGPAGAVRAGAASAADAARAAAAAGAASAAGALALAPDPDAGFGLGDSIGTNTWVIAGSRTASGKPLLANDPHLGLGAPSVWYLAHLKAPGLDVRGATLPGVPYVLAGRTPRVAWGMANVGTDAIDLYLERLHPADPQSVQTPDGHAPMSVRVETIRVRGSADVLLPVRATRHGPVISGASGSADKALAPERNYAGARYVLALRWTALDGEDRTLAALRAINRAGSAAEFVAATESWQTVSLAMPFADADGRIGLVAPGRVPVRRADHDLKGLVPAPGWDARYDWTGFVPARELPRMLDPADGRLVAANHKFVAAGYPHHLAHDWALPYRAERIAALLDARRGHTVATQQATQADIVSLAARDLLAALRATLGEARPASRAAQLALERLFAWDGTMAADRPEPLLFHAWLRALRARVFDDELGALAEDFVAGAELTRATLLVLRGETKHPWCDDLGTGNRVETCAELAVDALEAAVTALGESGRDVLSLRWGDAHRAVFEHRPMSGVPPLRRLFEVSVPLGGDTQTVNVAALSLRGERPFTVRHGPSMRAIHDLADPAADRMHLAPGQSGHPFADGYASMIDGWRRADVRRAQPAGAGPEAMRTVRLMPGAARR